MPNYTYFIITPGYEANSYVQYGDGNQGVYIKFGDQGQNNPGKVGIRNAYLTHNPDIGVACVMNSNYANPLLGTLLKKFIIDQCHIAPVGNTEWFSVTRAAGWALFNDMLGWDNVNVNQGNEGNLLGQIHHRLT